MNLITPLADATLLEHRAIALSAALPGKGQMGATMETALLSLAQSVVAQTNDARLAREANAAAQEQPALPSTSHPNYCKTCVVSPFSPILKTTLKQAYSRSSLLMARKNIGGLI